MASDNSVNSVSSVSRLARVTQIALIVYWLAMFVGTHVHIPSESELMPLEIYGDKILHFTAFAGLGFLLAAYRWQRAALTLSSHVKMFSILALYGAADELTQIPVGRTADWMDWVAGILGSALGLIFFAFLAAGVRRLSHSRQDPK